uniref:cGMP-dependent protein kinase n=1 Tax=Culex pipiens TaxID=7175 RepID=A0A8D8A7Y8_CULPI
METIKKENIQISDNGGPAAAAAGSLTQSSTTTTTTSSAEVLRDEKSQIEKSVHSQSALKTKQSWFRKSNTCGSLYAKCACSNGVSGVGQASAGAGSPTGNHEGKVHRHSHGRPISTSEKDFRKIRVLQAFVHPDTTTVFTQENCYPGSDSPTRASLITSAQAGEFQILHSTHSKRQSTPNCGATADYAAAFHPEFVLKKVAPKKQSANGLPDARSPSISIPSPRKVPLKKSSRSYPGLSPSDSSVESIIRAFGQRSTSSSVDEVTEEDDCCAQTGSETEELGSLRDSYISFTATTESENQPPPAISDTNGSVDQVCESDIQLEERSDSDSSSSNTSSDNSPPSQLLNPLPAPAIPCKLNPSAHEFFIQSGILGPMGNGSSVLLRKTSKIVPNVDAPVKEKIRKKSKMLYGSRTVLTGGGGGDSRRKSIPPDSNCDSFQSYGSTPTLNSSSGGGGRHLPRTLEDEINNLRQLLKARDEEISKLRREIDKLKSVLQQTTTNSMDVKKQQQQSAPVVALQQLQKVPKTPPVVEGDLLSSIQANYVMAGQQLPVSELFGVPGKGFKLNHGTPSNVGNGHIKPKGAMLVAMKKQGVSGESCELMGSHSDIKIPKYDKDYSAKQLIKDAILENDFFKNIDSLQIREIVDSMYSREFRAGEYVIHEGQAGSHLYVSASGNFEVLKDSKSLGFMGPGKAFGELAILYNCTRTASIRVLCDSRVWVLDRRVFQQIMMRTGLQRIEENVNFLRSVPLLKNLSNDVLTKIADVLEVEFYPAGAYIIRQGAAGDTFFLISQGTVKVTQRLPGRSVEEEIRILGRGEYFGEKALIKEDKRTANIIAMSPGVECLTLDRESFTKHIGDLCELHEKDYGDAERVLAFRNLENQLPSLDAVKPELMDVELSSLEIVGTLGVGGFGRVELVKLEQPGSIRVFALKCMKKKHIVDTRQQEHVYSERKIMLACNSPFICRLYRTYRNDKYVYMLLEACMGGEVWTILRDRTHFEDGTAKFIVGCVLKAFEFLHSRGIVYRDLKPENLLLDSKGYVKLVDFGFAKFIGYSSKTWTFCGTPEYVAPEIVLNRGHDRSVDYWALGVLIHELLTGIPPFAAADPMKTYNIILKGIDMVNFPKHMSRSAVSLIKRLCRDIPSERLGYQRGGVQDIKKHKWFQGFDWEGLANQTLKSPLQPKLKGPLDMSNFDVFPSDPSVPPVETSGWDADF